jgi:maleate isomerase
VPADPRSTPPGPPIGLLVPPANPTVEPEMYRLLGASATPYTARLPYLPDLPLIDRLACYTAGAGEAIRSFGAIPLRAVVFACTGSSYLHGPEADAAFCADLSAAYGTAVTTAASAVLRELRELGLGSVTLVSPYPDWLTELSSTFWEAAGIEVRDVVRVPGDGSIYDLTSGRVLDVISRACDPKRHGALLLTGTGMPTAPAIEALASTWPYPVLSSAVCSARWVRAVTAPAVEAPDGLG